MSFQRHISAFAATVAIASVSQVSSAEPKLTTRFSTNRPEAGEPYTIQLSVSVSPGEPYPSDPVLKPARGATIMGGPTIMNSRVSINGVVQVGIEASWQLVSNAPGKVKIPAPSVLWDGKRISGKPIEIEVVPSSGRSRHGNNPFLLPGGPGIGGFGFFGLDRFGDPREEDLPPIDPTLEMPRAPDPHVFVRAIADKKTAVVGEQVTVTFYVYRRIHPHNDDRPERNPGAPDFLRHSLFDGAEQPMRAKAGGQIYNVSAIDRMALFPIRTGDLHVGSMQISFTGRQIGRGSLRSSEDLVIRVTEPPQKDRPAGYVLGNVGRFSMAASVEPRRIHQGETIAATIKVSGNGNFPQSLTLPERTGVEWLDPEKKEAIGAQGNIISGYRSFGYVVRIKESGTVNLGKVELPHWDPAMKKYQVASVDLGTIDVLPAKPAAIPTIAAASSPGDAEPPPVDPFANIPGARTNLGAYNPGPAPVFDGSRLYFAVGAPPLAFAFFSLATAAGRRLQQRRAAGAVSPEKLARTALEDADRARAASDTKAVCGALERALHHAIKAATDLESRGILLADLTDELQEAGLSEALASQTKSLFEEISALRFAPDASDQSIEDLLSHGRSVVRELLDPSTRLRG